MPRKQPTKRSKRYPHEPRDRAPAAASSDAPAASQRTPRWWIYLGIGVPAAAALVLYLGLRDRSPSISPSPSGAKAYSAAFIGSAACAACHAEQHRQWASSQHALAMLAADSRSVRGDFSGTRYTHADLTSRFAMREGRYFVHTDGPDGKPGEFEIKYTFGVEPLQQYLIEQPGGRLQALGIAWDTRPARAGGQRWFHLYPDRKLSAGDPLHWTGVDQNWNYQCADCHSTNLRKQYDAASGSFASQWSEISVGCESCHGPGSVHVAWAKKGTGWQTFEATKGLTAALDERHGVRWTIDPQSSTAKRSVPREANREIEVCARCHARRGQFTDQLVAGQPFHDGYRPALLDPGLYYSDGQQRDEVYTYGSFLQSRMHAAGVTCSDCHDPHTQALRAQGNALCAQCHAPARYDDAAHHHHPIGSAGTQCTGCHMPATTYMLVDPRHDHSMRIPRPDRSVSMGVPNACNQCHRERSAQWAAARVASWFPAAKAGFQGFAEALHAGDRGAPGAQGALLSVIDDRAQSAISRASALARMERYLNETTLQSVSGRLNDSDANVRMAAVQALSAADPATRLRYLPRMLSDAVRVVRMDAARALAGEAERQLSSAHRPAFDLALGEYVSALSFNADRPEAHAALGNLRAARGEFEPAASAYRTALRLDPTFVQAAVNLGDLYRARGMEREAEAVLRDALRSNPRSAAIKHSLGLALTRQKRGAEGLAALGAAARWAPEEPRFAYVFAVALHDSGKRAESLRVLTSALERNPYDRDILIALGTYELEAGRADAARTRAKLLRALEPSNPEVARLAAQLERGVAPASP